MPRGEVTRAKNGTSPSSRYMYLHLQNAVHLKNSQSSSEPSDRKNVDRLLRRWKQHRDGMREFVRAIVQSTEFPTKQRRQKIHF